MSEVLPTDCERARPPAAAPRVAAGVLLGAMLGGLAAGAFATKATQSELLLAGPRCLFLAATGAPCPFCGMSRATLALGAGDLGAALALHPLAPLVLAAVAGFLLIVIAGKGAWLMRRRVAATLIAALAAVWLVRLLA